MIGLKIWKKWQKKSKTEEILIKTEHWKCFCWKAKVLLKEVGPSKNQILFIIKHKKQKWTKMILLNIKAKWKTIQIIQIQLIFRNNRYLLNKLVQIPLI